MAEEVVFVSGDFKLESFKEFLSKEFPDWVLEIQYSDDSGCESVGVEIRAIMPDEETTLFIGVESHADIIRGTLNQDRANYYGKIRKELGSCIISEINFDLSFNSKPYRDEIKLALKKEHDIIVMN